MARAQFIADAIRTRFAEKIQAQAVRTSAVEAVDTGRYTASWRVTTIRTGRTLVVRVHNKARSPDDGFNYPATLEWGWRTRNGRHILGKHILARSISAART